MSHLELSSADHITINQKIQITYEMNMFEFDHVLVKKCINTTYNMKSRSQAQRSSTNHTNSCSHFYGKFDKQLL